MKYAEALHLITKGFSDARAFLTIGSDQPSGTPLYKEMQQAALEAMSWVNNDEIIDILHDADRNSDDDEHYLI